MIYPLNRPWKVTPPTWYPTIYAYSGNLGTNVKLNHTTNTWYPANSLYQTTVEDPNGNRSFNFTDKKGRLVLGRRRNNSGTQEANTYHLYDNKDRLSTVIPPDATISNTNLIFRYLYDAADNMTSKDVPDAAPMAMMYDARNLMTLMQDGNLRAATPTAKWLATVYDTYGRPTKTGFLTAASPNPNSFTIATADVLTETTYDLSPQAIYKGKVKQRKVKILDGGTSFITTDFTYDAHGRVSATSANNHTGGTDSYSFVYDWADNPMRSTRSHKRVNSDPSFTTIVEKTVVDRAGRPIANKHSLNGAADTHLSRLKYDHRGRLTEKNLGVGTGTALQSIDFAYNEQGWLTMINQPTLGGGTSVALSACQSSPVPTSSGTPDNNDLFYLELKYDALFSGMPGTVQKNGNIAQMQWRTRGRERQAYSFTYDYLDRLTAATDYDLTDAGTATANSRYNESINYADARGNISGLTRRGGIFSAGCWGYGQIDNLAYTYSAGTNKVKTITDASGNAKGFKPQAGATDYIYDVNGNMTYDPHKALTITYNHLDLPKTFNFGGGKVIDIVYDAAGNKLRKTVSGTINYMQDYIGGIEYRGPAMEAVYHGDGRVRYISGVPRYEYVVKDHLGNTRLSFTDLNGNGMIEVTSSGTTNEVLQENHYYPFGLNMEGPWLNDEGLDYKYQYNDKEWNDDYGLNLNDYGARWYDPARIIWSSVDPMAPSTPYVNPFNYVENTPINAIDPDGMSCAGCPSGYDPTLNNEKTGIWVIGSNGQGKEPDPIYDGGTLPAATVKASRLFQSQDVERYGYNGSWSDYQEEFGLKSFSHKEYKQYYDYIHGDDNDRFVNRMDAIALRDRLYVLNVGLHSIEDLVKVLPGSSVLGLGGAGLRGFRYVRSISVYGRGGSSNMSLASYWPSNGGALGKWESEYLMPGTQIDRFGSGFGKYFSPRNNPMEMRALPPGNTGAYNAFKVVKPFAVQSSTIAPAFGQIGLGKQFLGSS